MTCQGLDSVAAWVLDELPLSEAEQLEAHVIACEACTCNVERVQRLAAELAMALPHVLTVARRHAKAVREPGREVASAEPERRARLRLGVTAPVGIWVMQAPLEGATRVDLEARSASGELVLALSDVPFDAARGEVVMACQAHYQTLPGWPELHLSLTAASADGERPVGEYVLDHEIRICAGARSS